jgi:hypothetical protein
VKTCSTQRQIYIKTLLSVNVHITQIFIPKFLLTSQERVLISGSVLEQIPMILRLESVLVGLQNSIVA